MNNVKRLREQDSPENKDSGLISFARAEIRGDGRATWSGGGEVEEDGQVCGE